MLSRLFFHTSRSVTVVVSVLLCLVFISGELYVVRLSFYFVMTTVQDYLLGLLLYFVMIVYDISFSILLWTVFS